MGGHAYLNNLYNFTTVESNFIKVSELNNRLSEFKDSKFIIEGIIWEIGEKHTDGFSLECYDSNALSEEYLISFENFIRSFVIYNSRGFYQNLIGNSKKINTFDCITHFCFSSYYDDVILEIYDNNNSVSRKEIELELLNHLNLKIIN